MCRFGDLLWASCTTGLENLSYNCDLKSFFLISAASLWDLVVFDSF